VAVVAYAFIDFFPQALLALRGISHWLRDGRRVPFSDGGHRGAF
jgi:hypothetical protein